MSALMTALMPAHSELAERLTEPSVQALQDRIMQFQREKFPEASLDATLAHLQREVKELRDNPRDGLEWADVFILFLAAAGKDFRSVADLVAVAHTKTDINEIRTWGEPDGEGVCQHVEKP